MSEPSTAADGAVAELRHELRTPLNQIIGYAELVAEDLEGEEHAGARADLEKIGRAARGLADLITKEIQPGRIEVTGERPVVEGGGDTAAAVGVEVLNAQGSSSKGARILVVDDQPENCEVLLRRLEKEGHMCAVVHNGADALELLAERDFDLVLLDILMPGIDGREVLRRVKEDDRLRHLPVIMISALDEIENVVACIELGAEDFLPKPFNPVLLRARINASLERKSLRDAEQAAFAALKESQDKLAGELAEAAAYVQGVLPPPLAEGPVRTSWVFQPSSSLGGDAFGYGWLGGGKFGLCLLDVCGHGVGAALLSISVLNVIRSESLPGVNFLDPGAVLAGLNEAFPMDRHGEMFFTAWCGIYDPASRILRYAAGGHPPAVLILPGGETAILASGGPVIGALGGVSFRVQETTVPTGSRVFVFSDGAYEIQRADGTMACHRDLVEILKQVPPAAGAAWVMARLRELNGESAFDDDVSLVELSFP